MADDASSRRATYQPALDGIRGVSVAMVLLFHGGFTWMTGGYVGVSVFFTLSGFLITGLLLAEHRSEGRVSMGRFYARRVRRLMPASLLCLAGIAVAAVFGEFGGLPHVRRDVLAALLQVANWNALHNGTSYADLVARTAGQLGPVDHFWSLSVEEQFYWLWPALGGLLIFRLRRKRAVTGTLVALAAAGIVAAPVIARVWGENAAYWATPARLGEILVGAALAALVTDRARAMRWLGWFGLGALALIVVIAVTWPSSGGPAYHGWFGVFSLASAAVILGAQPDGPLKSVLSVRPLVHLGRISYGVYLYHWPIFAMLTGTRVGVGGWWLFAIRIAATMVVAELSFHLLEQPIRRGSGPLIRVAWVTPIAIAIVAALVVVVVPVGTPVFSGSGLVPATFGTDPVVASTLSSAPATVSTSPAGTTSGTTNSSTGTGDVVTTSAPPSLPARPVSVLMLGDSTAVALADGFFQWAQQHTAEVRFASLAAVGCGFILDALPPGDLGRQFLRICKSTLLVDLPKLLAKKVPDVVIVLVTLPDVGPRLWNDKEGSLLPHDQRYRDRLLAAYQARADMLISAGVRHIIWTMPVHPSSRWLGSIAPVFTDEDWAVFTSTITEVAQRHPKEITVARMDQWMAVHEPADGSMRNDGLHLTLPGAVTVTDQLFGPLAVRAGQT
jgi:peptidoglycan/LPS O-acetylase OafA/YrhL